uniref:Uncharacterized protein n=1 Tax=Octopus bimaculoides TaxID=37653 RepID=A0A0L8FN73_OCTBM
MSEIETRTKCFAVSSHYKVSTNRFHDEGSKSDVLRTSYTLGELFIQWAPTQSYFTLPEVDPSVWCS